MLFSNHIGDKKKMEKTTSTTTTTTTAVATTAVATKDGYQVSVRTLKNGKKVFTFKAVEYQPCSTQKKSGRVGVSLSYNENKDMVYALVKGVKLLVKDVDGKALLDINPARDGYESIHDYNLVKGLKASSLEEIKAFLNAKYGFENKPYKAIKKIARSGGALLNKKEAK